MVLTHQTFLAAGPSEESMQQFNDSVRVIIGDLGNESRLADIIDLVAPYLAGEPTGDEDALQDSYMYKHAIQVPGPNHFADWILAQVLYRLSTARKSTWT